MKMQRKGSDGSSNLPGAIFKMGDFNKLMDSIKLCNLDCPINCYKNPIFNEKCGNPKANILFIGEAPGVRGADKTEINFYGDTSGDLFNKLLESVNIKRKNVFVTNCVLCNPKNNKGNNRSPTDKEIKVCSYWLKEQIKTINPKVIVTIGTKALRGLYYIRKHNFSIKRDVGKIKDWGGKLLVPLYHTSNKVRNIYRDEEQQINDWKILKNLVRITDKNMPVMLENNF